MILSENWNVGSESALKNWKSDNRLKPILVQLCLRPSSAFPCEHVYSLMRDLCVGNQEVVFITKL